MELEAPRLVRAALREGTPARLRGGSCEACGHRFFPPHPYSCERCGSLETREEEFPAQGTVRAAVLVRRRDRDGGSQPAAVANVALDAGPVVRAMLRDSDPLPAVGQRVAGIAVASADEPGRLALRFAAAS